MKVKIIMVGPKGCGKTQISNFLSNQTDTMVIGRIDPTAGVRILESEVKGKGNSAISVELWDSSGDSKYEGCWRAIMSECDGVVLVYNPDAPAQDQQLNDWFDFFVRKNALKDEQCLVLAHRNNQATERFRAPPLFTKVSGGVTTPQQAGEVRGMWDNFVREIAGMKMRK